MISDVRTFPASRKYPQYHKENLEKALSISGIEYQHMPLLGGRRRSIPGAEKTAWRNVSFQNYAAYMATAEFELGIAQLEELSKTKNVCYMCSEAVWWRCHRGLISDSLKVAGWEVLHILSSAPPQEHPFTSVAKVVNGHLSYKA